MNATDLSYRPSLLGRVARVAIPALQRLLPAGLYRTVYDGLYEGYKRMLRLAYEGTYLRARLGADSDRRLQTRLTRRLYRYSMGGSKALENAFAVTRGIERDGVEGALVECGVAEGGTAAMLALTNRELGDEPRMKWFFDSYEGLPEPTAEDYAADGRTGTFIRPLPEGSCLGTIEQVSELMFDTLDLRHDEVRLVKGWFQDTVPAERDEVGPIAVLRLDGDWYESTRIPLDNFYDQVSPGGAIIIDDYGTCFGSQRAVDEFRDERDIDAPLIPDGRGGAWFRKPVG